MIEGLVLTTIKNKEKSKISPMLPSLPAKPGYPAR
jgi:hypothetical protein